MTNQIKTIFKDEITELGLAELRDRYPSTLVVDMSDDEQFKKARKTRTECNKLVKAINTRRIDTTAELKGVGDDLVAQVEEIYSVVVDPFMAEDSKRKEAAKAEAEAKQKVLDEQMAKVNKLKGMVTEANRLDSAGVSGLIDALTNIDVMSFHKDLVHEVQEVKTTTLESLGQILTSKIQSEQLDKEREEMAAERAALQAEKDALQAERDALAEKAEPEVKPELPIATAGEMVANAKSEVRDDRDIQTRTITIEVTGTREYWDLIHDDLVNDFIGNENIAIIREIPLGNNASS